MKIKLIISKEEDIKEIAEIYMKEFSKPPYNEAWTVKKAIDKLNFYKKYYDLYSIKINEEVVGFIVINSTFMCPGEVAFGEEMAIQEDLQRKGIGTETLNKIFKIYKEKGFKKFMGIVNVEAKAFELYKKLKILPSKQDILIEKKL